MLILLAILLTPNIVVVVFCISSYVKGTNNRNVNLDILLILFGTFYIRHFILFGKPFNEITVES